MAQILITGEIAEPTTEPRPVVNRISKNQPRIVNQHGTVGNIFQRLGHRGGRLSPALPVERQALEGGV
jgi:hypothetical protein